MSQFLRDALLDLLFQHMAFHLDRGVDYDEALTLGVDEIRRQIRQSRGDVTEILLSVAVCDVINARERLH